MIRPLRIFRHYVPALTLALFLGDAALFSAAALLGVRLAGAAGADPTLRLPAAAAAVALGLLALVVAGVYDLGLRPRTAELVVRVLAAAALWAVLAGAVAFALPALRPGRLAWFTAILLGASGTLALRALLWLLPSAHLRERLLFLGATPVAARLVAEVEARHPAYEILGYVDDGTSGEPAPSNGFRVLGPGRHLAEIATATRTGTIVVALTERRGRLPLPEILDCKLRGIRVEDWPAFYEKLTGKILVQNLRPSWLVFSEGFARTRGMRIIKRLADLVLSALFLLGGWPVFLLVALAVKLDSPGPVLFRQERVGEGGRPFSLLKFRTMVKDAETLTGPVWATQADPRITRVGRWLRATRLDEFPQLLNVLRGEMSFIGPRPERPHFVATLQERIPYYAQRHTVKPGITGWAQVCYRYGATVQDAEEKLQYDLYYIKNMSPFLDLLILVASVQVVLLGKGAR